MRRPTACRPWLLPAILAGLLAGGFSASAAAQDPPENQPPLQFIEAVDGEPVREIGPVQEGYVTLVWTRDPQAAGYRVLGESGRVLYEGRMRQTFLSGLPDGVHEFRVASVDEQGEVIREGPQPVTVTVEHWPLALAWTLFGVGAVVMLALVTVLVIGSRDSAMTATT